LLGIRQAGILHVPDDVVRSATGLAGGGGGTREVCGALIAGIQAIGLEHGRVDKSVDRKPAMDLAGKLVGEFRERYGTASCRALVENFADVNSAERKEHCASFVAFVAGRLESLLKDRDRNE